MTVQYLRTRTVSFFETAKMDRWVGKVAIVTGSSAGIGAATSRELVHHGIKVVGLARRLDKMQELQQSLKGAKGEFHPIECDVTKEADILKAFEWVEEKFGGADILINNAGVAEIRSIIDSDTQLYEKIMDVNVKGVALCSREIMKSLRKRKAFGHIININSIAGHFAESIKFPINYYCASKYAVTGFSHSLRNEVEAEKLNIKITSLSPGAVDTPILSNMNFTKEQLEKIPKMQDKDIADAVIYALGTPPNVEVMELMIKPVMIY